MWFLDLICCIQPRLYKYMAVCFGPMRRRIFFFRTKFCFAMSTWHVSTYMSYVESQCYSIFFMNLIFWFFIQLTQVSVFFAMAKYSKLTLKSLKTANFSCTFSIYHMVLSCHCTWSWKWIICNFQLICPIIFHVFWH